VYGLKISLILASEKTIKKGKRMKKSPRPLWNCENWKKAVEAIECSGCKSAYKLEQCNGTHSQQK
jgi:hypothetical protein